MVAGFPVSIYRNCNLKLEDLTNTTQELATKYFLKQAFMLVSGSNQDNRCAL